MPSIISVKELSKHFKVPIHQPGPLGALRDLINREVLIIEAVDRISFQIQPGELVGYIGPNGAGKSTTLKMLTGLLVPSGGEVMVDGRVPWQQRETHVAHIGAVFGQRSTLWWDLPVIESLDLLQHIYRIPPQKYRRNLGEFRELLDLDPFLHTPVRSLSLGQRMRADICAALLHGPALLFLDEPTIGLDVVAKERIREFILHVHETQGTTVLLTTHDLSDVEKLCERVLIIDHGHLLFDGKLATLRERFGRGRELQVEFAEDYDNVHVEGAAVSARDARRVTYRFDRHSVSASTLIGRLSERYSIRDLSVREPEIADIIRRIYEGRLLGD
jgi:ABC-2 type transport system ATP-binding protein